MNVKLLRTIRLVSFVLIFALAGFYASLWLRNEPAPATAIEITGTQTAEPIETLPEFTLADLAGSPRSIVEFSGKPLLINFWATWCAPCLREMPMFETLWQERSANGSLQIVGIAIDRLEDVEPYLKQTGVTYPTLVGRSDAMEAADSFGSAYVGLPFTVFVSAERQILHMHSGELHREQLDDIMTVVDDVFAGTISVTEARARLTR
jgi:thiol-disulfide isomerase/thioredoxin